MNDSYDGLLKRIGELCEQTWGKSKAASNQSVLRMNWTVGGMINEERQQEKEERGTLHGSALIKKLSMGLRLNHGDGFSVSNLRAMLKFHSEYKLDKVSTKLSWSHYRILLSIEDLGTRAKYERRAVKEGFSKNILRAVVRTELGVKLPEDGADVAKLTLPTGKLYCHKVARNLRSKRESYLLDLGFDVMRKIPLSGKLNLRVGETLQSRKHGAGFRFKKVNKGKKSRYAYRAYLDRVVDGDTVVVQVDLGFDTLVEKRLRLRGVYAPEKGTAGGKKATGFLKAKLANVKLLAIKTYSVDMYYRFVADIMYLKGERDAQVILDEGMFLNQELLDAGVASSVER